MPLDPAFLNILLGLAITIPILCWLINQLPPLQDVPGKTPVIIANILALLIIVAQLNWVLPDNPEPHHLQTQQVLDWLKLPCYVIFTSSILYLGGMVWGQRQNRLVASYSTQQLLEYRRKLLSSEQKNVTARLADTLHQQELIHLVAEAQPEQVGKPSPLAPSSPEKPSFWQKLPDLIFRREKMAEEGKPIREVFEESGQRLLILGDPGAGKTTLLLDLARALMIDAQQNSDRSLPVIFELSAWKEDKQSIADWLATDLQDRYNIPLDMTKSWLEQGQLLPLLDGLDELGLVRQQACIEQLNEFFRLNGGVFSVVVCCRHEEYLAGDRIFFGLRGAVCLQPLTDGQIEAHLRRLKYDDLWADIQKDEDGLLALARIPLFLHLIPVAYSEGIPQGRRQAQDLALYQRQVRGQLFDAYIDRKLMEHWGKNQGASHKLIMAKIGKSKCYLSWLARQLKKQNQTEFLLERMQPNLLERQWLRIVYRIILGLTFGLIVGITYGIAFEIFYGITFGILAGLLLIFIDKKINPSEAFTYSLKSSKSRTIFYGPISGLMYGILYGIIRWLMYGLASEIIIIIVMGIIGGLFMGIIIWLTGGIKKKELKTRIYPNQGIIQSAKNAILIGLITYFCIVFLIFLIRYTMGQEITTKESLLGGIFIAFSFGLNFAGFPVFQHYILRFFLWQSGATPLNYVAFLNQACEQKILKRVGGRYRFIHDLLREHLAHS
ncbi:NACHT domain-containing protein [Spirulina sp. CCNP1310]|uniref:NACHT domain-containing protein n=1 Tax=Spirulina sp. CCNP1310 TaxID=3110249 RepID=UPI002B1F5196|nr:NACHT domain-containing protein [Spirulina sp. CCNP1310]MEA5417662.1 NACHT domain-containing protein [Spirulina sp. CCNP1310]